MRSLFSLRSAKLPFDFLIALALIGSSTGQSARGQSADFFGMHVRHRDPDFWPQVPFHSLRLHDSGVSWREIEVAPGKYDWTTLDQQLKRGKEHRVDVLYDFVRTPEFYTSRSQCSAEYGGGSCDAELCAEYGGRNRNGCFPPNDLGRDGSGSDQHFRDFVAAVVNHVKGLPASSFARISTWEIWNEFDNKTFWQGTNRQLLRMAQDARAIVKGSQPDAMVTSPNAILPRMLRPYLDQPGAAEAADALSLHSYVGRCDPEEPIQNKLKIYARLREDYGRKPIYITEASWGKEENCADPAQEAAFTARYLLLMNAGVAGTPGVERLWWYGYDYGTGHLADPQSGEIQPAGRAFGEVYNWITTAILVPQSCKEESGTRWTCTFSGANGYQAVAVWDTAPERECRSGSCRQTIFSAPSKFKQSRSVTGKSSPINGSAPIGSQPVLLENSSSKSSN